jgi:hypothetical protein
MSSLRLGRVDGRDSGWLHPSGLGEAGDVLDVSLGPSAVRPTGREALAIAVVITSSDLSVDPAEAQRLVKRFRVGQGRRLPALLTQHQPDPRVVGMVAVQPGVPHLGVLYKQLHEIGHVARYGAAAGRGLKQKSLTALKKRSRAL